jgi:hypothetical protein
LVKTTVDAGVANLAEKGDAGEMTRFWLEVSLRLVSQTLVNFQNCRIRFFALKALNKSIIW